MLLGSEPWEATGPSDIFGGRVPKVGIWGGMGDRDRGCRGGHSVSIGVVWVAGGSPRWALGWYGGSGLEASGEHLVYHKCQDVNEIPPLFNYRSSVLMMVYASAHVSAP